MNPPKLDQLSKPKKPCRCSVCKRTRRIERISKSLSKSDSDYLLRFYDYVFELESERDMEREAGMN